MSGFEEQNSRIRCDGCGNVYPYKSRFVKDVRVKARRVGWKTGKAKGAKTVPRIYDACGKPCLLPSNYRQGEW